VHIRTFGDTGRAGSLRVAVKNDLGDINETEVLSVLLWCKISEDKNHVRKVNVRV
jgi:hypothetical protein